MKVLLLNGSPHERGCTYTALAEVEKTLQECGVETEILWLGNGPVQDCIGCHSCHRTGACVFQDDIVSVVQEKAQTADGFVFGTPVYYAHPSGRILSILDRVFFARGKYFSHKPAASVVSARRGGTTASFDVMNKYFTISEMPVVSSSYWNMVHGNKPEDVLQDAEGLQTMRNLARNMAWLLKCIEKSGLPAPETERGAFTNFIR